MFQTLTTAAKLIVILTIITCTKVVCGNQDVRLFKTAADEINSFCHDGILVAARSTLAVNKWVESIVNIDDLSLDFNQRDLKRRVMDLVPEFEEMKTDIDEIIYEVGSIADNYDRYIPKLRKLGANKKADAFVLKFILDKVIIPTRILEGKTNIYMNKLDKFMLKINSYSKDANAIVTQTNQQVIDVNWYKESCTGAFLVSSAAVVALGLGNIFIPALLYTNFDDMMVYSFTASAFADCAVYNEGNAKMYLQIGNNFDDLSKRLTFDKEKLHKQMNSLRIIRLDLEKFHQSVSDVSEVYHFDLGESDFLSNVVDHSLSAMHSVKDAILEHKSKKLSAYN